MYNCVPEKGHYNPEKGQRRKEKKKKKKKKKKKGVALNRGTHMGV